MIHRLADLSPRLILHDPEHGHRPVDDIEKAEGVKFRCPICVTAHDIVCKGQMSGTGLGDVTLGEGGKAAVLQGGCGWHGRVEAGWVGTI